MNDMQHAPHGGKRDGTNGGKRDDARGTQGGRDGLGAMSAKSRTMTIVAGVAIAVVAFLAIGFAVSWGLAAIFAIIMIPGAISMAIVARHPEKTGGRSMLGVSDPDTLLEPFTGKRK